MNNRKKYLAGFQAYWSREVPWLWSCTPGLFWGVACKGSMLLLGSLFTPRLLCVCPSHPAQRSSEPDV